MFDRGLTAAAKLLGVWEVIQCRGHTFRCEGEPSCSMGFPLGCLRGETVVAKDDQLVYRRHVDDLTSVTNFRHPLSRPYCRIWAIVPGAFERLLPNRRRFFPRDVGETEP
jgi:hypothetical protein